MRRYQTHDHAPTLTGLPGSRQRLACRNIAGQLARPVTPKLDPLIQQPLTGGLTPGIRAGDLRRLEEITARDTQHQAHRVIRRRQCAVDLLDPAFQPQLLARQRLRHHERLLMKADHQPDPQRCREPQTQGPEPKAA